MSKAEGREVKGRSCRESIDGWKDTQDFFFSTVFHHPLRHAGIGPHIRPWMHSSISFPSYSLNILPFHAVMGYGQDRWGSIPSGGKIFPFSMASRLALEPTQPPV
jgi:hypothetical protein